MNDQSSKKTYWFVFFVMCGFSIMGHASASGGHVESWVLIFEAIAVSSVLIWLNRFELQPGTKGQAVTYAILSFLVLMPIGLVTLSAMCDFWGRLIVSHMSPERALMDGTSVESEVLKGLFEVLGAVKAAILNRDLSVLKQAENRIHFWILAGVGLWIIGKYGFFRKR